jgi:hypothetical protein
LQAHRPYGRRGQMSSVPGQSPPHDGNDHRRASPQRICVLFAIGHNRMWWSQTGSNRRPQACKASALPTELWPQSQAPNSTSSGVAARDALVGLERFELSTSRLSSARSNQLSYRPGKRECCVHAKEEKRRRRRPALYFKEYRTSRNTPVVPS